MDHATIARLAVAAHEARAAYNTLNRISGGFGIDANLMEALRFTLRVAQDLERKLRDATREMEL